MVEVCGYDFGSGECVIFWFHIYIYIYTYIHATPPGLSTLFGHFLVEMTEVAHCPGCDASRPIRGECLVDAKVRRGLGLVPCPPKSPKAIHTLGVVVCRINLQSNLGL